MEWSLVTVTFNSEKKIRQYWKDFSIPDGCEWIVVDNSSSDDTARVAEELGGRVIELNENKGFAAANNVGFNASSGRYVAFVNPDVRVGAGDLVTLSSALDHRYALVAPQLVNEDGSLQPNGRGWPYLSRQVANRLRPSAGEGQYRLYAQPGDPQLEVVWLTGAVIAGRRETLASLGPWDESYFLYYEDVDLCLRARKKSVPSIVVGNVNWTHGWARESTGFRFTPWRRQLTSAARFYARNPHLLGGETKRAVRHR